MRHITSLHGATGATRNIRGQVFQYNISIRFALIHALRLEFAHVPHHVTAQGDRREDSYQNDADRQLWLWVLAQVCKLFQWTVRAYCLMCNHYQLLVETLYANLSADVRQINSVYTQLTHQKQKWGQVLQSNI